MRLLRNNKKGENAAMASETKNQCLATEWLEEDHLMLLECWARDGYTFEDIANRIGITMGALKKWRDQYPEINNALKAGREIVDYKVENALLKSALGYRTKEMKVTTVIRHGKVVETIKEVTDKEQAPNVSAAQCWLYNRLPDKWKNMNSRKNIIEDMMDEDTSIQVTVTRASKNQSAQCTQSTQNTEEQDDEWVDEVNKSIEIRKSTEEEIKEAQKAKKEKAKENKGKADVKVKTKVETETEDDLDAWPDDWEDEEGWED